jgi:polysaccharide export outer membrane protein
MNIKNMNIERSIRILALALTVTAGLAWGQDKIVSVANQQPEIAATAPAATSTAASSATSSATPAAASDLTSSATPSTAPASTEKSFQPRHPRYKLEAGDAFEVSFELNPEFNQTVTVQPDGYITLRGVGDLVVVGETVPELTDVLRTAYNKILNDPQISVVLKDFEKPYFIADGQVGHPGKYDLRGQVTLTEAVAMAGGFLDSAKHSKVMLYRRATDGWYQAVTIDVKKMEHQGNLKEDPMLHAGDMVFVPKNGLSKVRPFIPSSSMGAFVPLSTP